MAEEQNIRKGAMAFVLGAVVVVLIGIVWYLYSGGEVVPEDEPDLEVELPEDTAPENDGGTEGGGTGGGE